MARLFYLGAGFSRFAGLPLGTEVFDAVVDAAKRTPLFESILEPDLERFRTFKKRTVVGRQSESFDAEEFMAFLDVEHFLRLKGGDVYSDEADRSQQLVKNLIAKLLVVRQSEMTDERWQPYLDFACRLHPGDTVVTFNYDTILETALERSNVPYRLVPMRLSEVHPGYGVVKTPETEVVVLKVHGSIDFFDIQPWQENRRFFAKFAFPIADRHPIFGNQEVFRPTPIVHEPYHEDSQLRRIHRVRDIQAFLRQANLVVEAPLILAPSHQKLLYSSPLKELWWGMAEAGSFMESVAIIGFSLPQHDQYALQAIYSAIRNFQHYDAGELLNKAPLKVVDFFPEKKHRAALKRRYRFVDWRRAELDGKGFRPEVVPTLFP